MSATTATDEPMVWLVAGEESIPASESRNMIRSNAAAWGHKTRRHGKRNPIPSKLPLAADMHFNVFDPDFWHAKSNANPLRPSSGPAALLNWRVQRLTKRSASLLHQWAHLPARGCHCLS